MDFPIDKEPLNFCEVIQGAVRSARQLARDKNITVNSELDTPVYKMTGDYGRLNQMLMIFLDNAVKFSPENSSIEVTGQPAPDHHRPRAGDQRRRHASYF